MVFYCLEAKINWEKEKKEEETNFRIIKRDMYWII